ncbi:MAG: helix-turn-helix domain-containing protein [Lachnospirales bacterium]
MNNDIKVLINQIRNKEIDYVDMSINQILLKYDKISKSIDEYKFYAFNLTCLIYGVFIEEYNLIDNLDFFPSYRIIEKLKNSEEINLQIKEYLKNIFRTIDLFNNTGKHIIIQNVLEDLRLDFYKDMGLAEYAYKYDVNPAYLSTLFKDEVGENFTKYLKKLRIDKAKKFLLQGMKISEVCDKVGYNNYRYFTKAFKTETGISPNEYKNGIR